MEIMSVIPSNRCAPKTKSVNHVDPKPMYRYAANGKSVVSAARLLKYHFLRSTFLFGRTA